MTSSWKDSLKNAITDPEVLLQTLELAPSLFPNLEWGNQLFPLRVPCAFVARMQKGNPLDPLLLQILPLGRETLNPPDFLDQPLEEYKHNPLPGLLHKYHGRVLLIANGICAVNCRYCFRRNFPYADNNPGSRGWHAVLSYIAHDPSISEVILSGGDPLTLTDSSLQKLVEGLEAIEHVQTLRIHTRIPVVLPDRIDAGFAAVFSQTRLNKVLVLHVNHPAEIDAGVKLSLQKLSALGFMLLNQAVLLRQINDDAPTQISLQRRLFDCGVLPYYLHVLDPVKGAAHFQVSIAEGKALLAKMRAALPGYLVPRLAQEIPGAASKTVLA